MKIIDADKLLEQIAGYDLDESSTEYKAFMREIALAPVEARTLGEWFRMKLRSRGHAIDFRFKDMPLTREGWETFQCWVIGLIIVYFILSVIGGIKLLDVWKH